MDPISLIKAGQAAYDEFVAVNPGAAKAITAFVASYLAGLKPVAVSVLAATSDASTNGPSTPDATN